MAASVSIPSPQKTGKTNLPVAYLRGFLILLVVAHHAALAYYPKAPPVPVTLLEKPPWWLAFVVVDPKHFFGFGPFVQFNDTFFMALLFLLSGLFVWGSLERKRPVAYIKGRLLRLGLPFAIFSLVGPFAYYPSYLQSRVKTGFWSEWMAICGWPAGPTWFLWFLLALDLVAIAIFTLAPSAFQTMSRKIGGQRHPYGILAGLFVLSAIGYVPCLLHFGPYDAWIWGPFYYQTCRTFYYPVYFLLGLALGASEQKNLLNPEGTLATHWWQWALGSAAGFATLGATNYLAHHIYYPVLLWSIAVGTAFALSSALSCFAFLAFFLHFVRQRRPVLDSLFACSFGIYLVHFFFVAWSQYGLLQVPAPAWFKGGVVFCVAVGCSWGITLLARRSRQIARVI